MRLFAKMGFGRKAVVLGVSLALISPLGHARGLPEWGMSSTQASFMINAVAIKSPPLNGPIAVIGAPGSPGQNWTVSTSWLEGYKVSLTNVTKVHWGKSVIEYVVYAQDSAGHIHQIYGNEELNEIPINGEITFITNQFEMQFIHRIDGRNTLPGKLLGVWVRIYDRKNELIQDYAAPMAIMMKQRWTYPVATLRFPGSVLGG